MNDYDNSVFKERWDDPQEVFKDLVALDELRRKQRLQDGQAGHFMRLLDRMAELTNTTCVEVLRALNAQYDQQFEASWS